MAPKTKREMPIVGAVAAKADLIVEVTWKAGSRAGITEILDLAPIVNAGKFFRRLRRDRALLDDVHVIAFGNAIAWGDDDEIDLSATSLERLAEETMRADDLRQFLESQDLTETALAAILDYSRRQIVGFVNGESVIPRTVALACRYIEIRNAPNEGDMVANDPLLFGLVSDGSRPSNAPGNNSS
jgi:hypothetical protein